MNRKDGYTVLARMYHYSQRRDALADESAKTKKGTPDDNNDSQRQTTPTF